MRLLWAAALLASSLICADAAGYTCPEGKSKKMVTLKTGDTFDLETQSGDTYGKNVKCVVKFKRAKRNKCDLNFSCSSFALTAAKPTCKGKSDFFKIGKVRYCEETGPEVSTTKGVLAVLFKSNKKSKGGAGASCTATCVAKGATAAPATTAAPPATTAAPATTASPATTTTSPTTATTTSPSTNSRCQGGIQAYPSSMPNSGYYTRLCTTSSGLRIVSAGLATDASLERTAFIIDKVTAHVDKAVTDSMNSFNFRHAVMAAYPKELTTDIPEHSFLDSTFWDERARGLGSTISTPVGSGAEENILCHSDDRYLGEDITVHEFAHSIMLLGFTQVDSGFDSELRSLYASAQAGNGWSSFHYGMTNYEEYFAEATQSYFDANQSASGSPTDREQLLAADPAMHSLLARLFGSEPWSRVCP